MGSQVTVQATWLSKSSFGSCPMRLVSRRSHLRCLTLSPVFVGFGYVAVVESAPLWLRATATVVVLCSLFQIVQYLACVRHWTWHDRQLNVPTLRQPDRQIALRSGETVHLVEHGFAQTLEIRAPNTDEPRRVAVNLFLSRRDVTLWAGALRATLQAADGEDR